MSRKTILSCIIVCGVVSYALTGNTARADDAIGFRVGGSASPDQFVIGGQAEFGRVFESARIAPSLDLGFGNDIMVTTANLDFRWYLIPLPETGLFFYGAAGPTVVVVSPDGGDSQTDIGLSLTAGVKIPMRGGNRYNLEARFGVGDIPDFKIMFGALFAL
jgi:hypothetical protein